MHGPGHCRGVNNRSRWDVSQCRVCWLKTTPALLPITPTVAVVEPVRPQCIHLRPITQQGNCADSTWYACAKFDNCRPHKECVKCVKWDDGKPRIEGITLAITHWQRPDALRRLLASISTFMPGYPVEIEDTGGNVSAARNRLQQRIATPYLVMMEEDFELTPTIKQELGNARAILEHDQKIAGVGGSTTEPGRGHVVWGHNFVRRGETCTIAASKRPMRRIPGGIAYRPCDLVLNWGLFRTALFRSVPWDEDFPITEHKTYFWTAVQAGHEFAFYNPLHVLHSRDRSNPNYNAGRHRTFFELVYKKHGFRFLQKE